MAYIQFTQFIQQSWREKKGKNKNKLMCINYTTTQHILQDMYPAIFITHVNVLTGDISHQMMF